VDAALLALPFGLAIGLSLGLVGGGGSVLSVPVLVYVLGESAKQATTESLAIVGTTALVAGIAHARGGGVRWRIAVVFGIVGAAGASVGTAAARLVSPASILFTFALVMLVAARALLRGEKRFGSILVQRRPRSFWPNVVTAGIGVGFVTGFFGIGGGFVIVPTFVLVLGLELPLAVGTSLIAIAFISAAALGAHLAHGRIEWPVAIAMTTAAVVGALLGSHLGNRVPSFRLTQLLAFLIVSVAVFLLAKNFVAVI
jgi:uncharacterized protein